MLEWDKVKRKENIH